MIQEKDSFNSTFDHNEILKYLVAFNNEAVVVLELMNAMKEKNTNHINQFYLEANQIASYTIFVSEWIKSIYESLSSKKIKSKRNYDWSKSKYLILEIYLNGIKKSKLKVYNSPLGNNWNKGFDVCQKLDEMLVEDEWKNLIDFTYIGNCK